MSGVQNNLVNGAAGNVQEEQVQNNEGQIARVPAAEGMAHADAALGDRSITLSAETLLRRCGDFIYRREVTEQEQHDAKDVAYFALAADLGYREAQYMCGESYREGRGVQQNFAEAAKYYKLAADQGYIEAFYELGFLGIKRKIPLSREEAIAYFYSFLTLSAQAAVNTAHYRFDCLEQSGYAYRKCIEFFQETRNFENIRHLLKIRADQEDWKMQYKLGEFLRDGIGGPKDLEGAKRYFTLAAQEGSKKASRALESILVEWENS